MKKIVVLCAILLAGCATPRYATPRHLVDAVGCNPAAIAEWSSRSLPYRQQLGWQDAETCMRHGGGDIKCFVTVVSEALAECPHYETKIITLSNYITKRQETVVFYIDDQDRRGVIRRNGDHWRYAHWTDWKDIVRNIPGGPWIQEISGII
jgi:hypothetical protein